jgi:hypothetical protein
MGLRRQRRPRLSDWALLSESGVPGARAGVGFYPCPHLVFQREPRAGGPAFEAVLVFRVAHLSRRVTDGDFDFDSRIEESM